MKRRYLLKLGLSALVLGGVIAQRENLSFLARSAYARVRPRRSLDDVLSIYGPEARRRLRGLFARHGAVYPPASVTLIGLKQEKRLELWVPGRDGQPVLIASDPILAASGGPGPKLKEGDRQVPEGLYRITYLNPNSRFHLSLRVNYPNAADRARADAEGREDPGGDIMIHGEGGSIGCLSMSDAVAEDLFVLAADTGIANIRVILSPLDMRRLGIPAAPSGAPPWTGELYHTIAAALARYDTA
ncbi:L,D-transpeptidase family protein [Minwuia sp.]|uniref:L,D-transpeptidase family protein n=1 Tax=Minwuia sp. TaxID=2493630 RepID=UPI003A93477D